MGVLRVNVAGQWIDVASGGGAMGIVATGTPAAGGIYSGAGPTDITGSIGFTSVLGRRYRVVHMFRAIRINTTAQVPFNVLRDGVAIGDAWLSGPAGGWQTHQIAVEFVGDGLFHNYKIQHGGITGQVEGASPSGGGSFFFIEDLGPATAIPVPVGGPLSGAEASKPASASAGTHYWATDTKRDWLYDGTGWIIEYEPPVTTFVPTISQGASTNIAKSMIYCSVQRRGGACRFAVRWQLTAAGTAAQPIQATLPYSPRAYGSTPPVGAGFVYTGTLYVCVLGTDSGFAAGRVNWANDAGAGAAVGQTPNIAAASGWVMTMEGEYEMASPYS